jgi:iron(III) transport system ATP-binding protein
MRSEILQLQKRLGITTVYVTHDQEEAMAISDRIAVMDRGSIAQIASAEDLYDRPRNEFVARFIGRANMLDGRLLTAGAMPSVEVLGQTIAVPAAPAGVQVGGSVSVMVRPERVVLAAAGGTGLAGKVLTRTFLGEKAEYHVAVGEQTIQATLFSDGRSARFAVGDAVQLKFPTENIHLIGA